MPLYNYHAITITHSSLYAYLLPDWYMHTAPTYVLITRPYMQPYSSAYTSLLSVLNSLIFEC